jgi:hypothetical protein
VTTPSPKPSAPTRSVTDIGPGDYVKIGSRWAKVAGNTAFGSPTTPRNWTVRTEDGAAYGMWQINAYAKAQDLET